ncbi:ankyrin repeat-containing domain protein [Rhypophila decipiens]|uniref:Ankyrin repeat-containing domain protein n=1 Tax=Rhypophila decipiens TaxID=261697 RepID=A0AAN7B9G8_9PEZI|nr:ankyrin repeat-containing domain protein [Rhypophila decipiens]
MWSDLEHAASTVDTLTTTGTMLAMSMNESGKAAFSLFSVYALGTHAPSKDIHDAIRYLTIAASANYGPAFVCGPRIFEANGILVPDVLLRGPQNDPKLSESLTILRSLPNDEYYSTAIQLFWPPSLKTDAKRILPKLPLVDLDSVIDFTEWIKARADSMGAESFRTWVRDILLFHHSVVRGSTDACDLLCRLGCDIDYATPAGVTPLHLAMRCAKVRVIELLLERGADPFINCNQNISPLHWLIVLPPKNVPRIAERLLTSLHTHQKGVLSDFRLPVTPHSIFFDDLGVYVNSSPIRWAIQCRNLPVVAALMDLGVSPIVNPVRPGDELFEAVGVGCARITERLLQSDSYRQQLSSEREGTQAFSYLGNSRTYFSRWMMHGALHDGAFGQVIDVMERFGFRLPLCQADMIEVPGNFASATPLCRAAMSFHLPVTKELLRRGCLLKAAEVIHLLLEHGATTSGKQPMVHFACGSVVSPEVLRSLLKKASPADIKSVYNRQTLLHQLFFMFAPQYDSLVEHQEKVKAVIEAGCDIDAEDGLGSDSYHRRSTFGKRPGDEMACCRTALAYALDDLHWATGQYLIERGAKLDFGVQSGHRQTVLHLLVYKVCRLRIKVRDNGDAEQRNEADSVEWAIKDLLVHPIVIKKGLLNMRNYQGLTALDVAKSCRVGSVMRILCDERYAPLT